MGNINIKNTYKTADPKQDIPNTEPVRQYYFIDKLKERLRAETCYKKPENDDHAAGSSHGLKYSVVTFGCQMNARDSEKLCGILEAIGYAETEDELSADLVIFNTCTIRENANEHLYGRLGRIKQSKKARPDMVVAVCGCMMQEADEVEKLSRKYPYIDIMFGTHNFYKFPELLYDMFEKREGHFVNVDDASHDILISSDFTEHDKAPHAILSLGKRRPGSALNENKSKDGQNREEQSKEELNKENNEKNISGKRDDKKELKLPKKMVVSVWKDNSDIVEELPNSRRFPFKQGVNISYGCNNFCSYCIVPYVRGREKSREKADILKEIRRLGEDGVKEIMLLGQNVNSYGKDLSTPVSFARLLTEVDELCDEAGIERIRFMTSHPKDLSDELIHAMDCGKHIMHQFHLPLQSGSDRILKLMNRHYDSAAYFERAEKLRRELPDISISTDIIVGFPGETEEDFEATLDMVKKMRYDAAYTFIYSEREGTPAASFPDKVPEDVVKERFQRLLSLQNRIAEENCERLVGRVMPVLFEELNDKDGLHVSGRLENNSVVHVYGDASLIGSIRDVRLVKAHGFYYTGELI
ncbi:MAG TPA: tRNA (N6-isopentenyl adenosine(37)-C2)-methylthiotransferase MiaB [Candidatus Avilachnospira avistercoris]|nr:tRNA (N6-isopentenyl adenosine(37)-C2)-methylthiotransferase MiaB [Candidatus Avilachnospira avistercoris]